MKSFKAAVVVIAICAILAGSMNQTNLKDMTVIEGLGVDASEDGVTLTAQSLNVAMSAGSESPEGNMTVTTSECGETVTDAVTNLSKAISKTLFFGHNRLVVLSREICENSIGDMIDFFLRSSVSRADIPVAVSWGDASQVLENTENESHVPIENAVTMIYNGQKTSTSVYVTTEELLNAYNDETTDIYLPVLRERADNDNTELYGIAVFKDDRLEYILDEEETLGFMLISGRAESCDIEFEDETLGVINAEISSLTVDKNASANGGDVIFEVEIGGSMIINEVENGARAALTDDDLERICTDAENRVNELCEKAYSACRTHGCDSLRVGEYLARGDSAAYQKMSVSWRSYFEKSSAECSSYLKIKEITDNTQYN